MKTPSAGALGLLIGAGLSSAAWLAAYRNVEPCKASLEVANAGYQTERERPAVRAETLLASEESPAPSEHAQAGEPRHSQPETLPECAAKLSLAQRAADDCTRELRRQSADREFEQGKPMSFPPSLDDKFKQEALVRAISAAFKDAGVKGDVQVTDCAEYPCIACGNLGDDAPQADVNALIGDARKVAGTRSMAMYRDVAKTGNVFTYRVEGTSLERTLFCQAFYPKPADKTLDAEIKKRVGYRIEQLKESLQ